MKFRIIFMCISLSMLIASSVCAQKVYYWKDEKGVMNATTTPPPDNIKKYEADSWGKRDSPEEIHRFQQQQKNYERDLEARQRYNRQEEASTKRFEASRDQQKEDTKLRIIERKEAAIERIDDLNAERELLRARENKNYRESRRLQLKDERRKIDRDIQKYNEIKNQ